MMRIDYPIYLLQNEKITEENPVKNFLGINTTKLDDNCFELAYPFQLNKIIELSNQNVKLRSMIDPHQPYSKSFSSTKILKAKSENIDRVTVRSLAWMATFSKTKNVQFMAMRSS